MPTNDDVPVTPLQVSEDHEPLLSFRLADQRYALPVANVLEVMAMVKLTRLPDAPDAMLGLANRHGDVLPMLDLRQAFGLGAVEMDVTTLFIVATTGNRTAGLVVDDVYQVKYIDNDFIRSTQGAGRYVTRIASDGDHLLQIVSLSPLFAAYLADDPAHQTNG